jgi:hypothetical protein
VIVELLKLKNQIVHLRVIGMVRRGIMLDRVCGDLTLDFLCSPAGRVPAGVVLDQSDKERVTQSASPNLRTSMLRILLDEPLPELIFAGAVPES